MFSEVNTLPDKVEACLDCNVCRPQSTTCLMHMPIFEWYYTARLTVKNGYQIDLCYDEIGLCTQTSQYNSKFST